MAASSGRMAASPARGAATTGPGPRRRDARASCGAEGARGGGWRERARPVRPGARFPAGDHCSSCGLCESYFVAHVGSSCAFLGEGMARIQGLERRVHGRGRREGDRDELRFGVGGGGSFYARVREPVDGAQWTGVVTTLAATMLEEGMVDAVVCTGSADGDPLRPVGVVARTVEEVLACRGVKPVVAPTLSVLAELERLVASAGVSRVLVVGVGCQVQALRAVEHHLGLERLYVAGTNCVDNGRSRETLDKFLRAAVPDRHGEVTNYVRTLPPGRARASAPEARPAPGAPG